MNQNKISKCIFRLWIGICCLLEQCKCATINVNNSLSKINEDQYNPFREKL